MQESPRKQNALARNGPGYRRSGDRQQDKTFQAAHVAKSTKAQVATAAADIWWVWQAGQGMVASDAGIRFPPLRCEPDSIIDIRSMQAQMRGPVSRLGGEGFVSEPRMQALL